MLKHCGYVPLPSHASGGFDHADVHLESGQVFIAHTANGTVEVIDGENLRHTMTVRGCSEASGVLCGQEEHLVSAAARATGKILTIDTNTLAILRESIVGSKPNGLAWDNHRKHLLVADVLDNSARLIDPLAGRVLATLMLPGRPRWCVYDREGDRFLVNIKEPAGVAAIRPDLTELRFIPVSVPGPHGLDLDGKGRAFIACDGAKVVVLDVKTEMEATSIPIEGEPDAIWYNSNRQRLYCAIGKPGVVDVIDTDRLVVDEKITTEEGAHTLTFDQERQRLYVFLPRSCRAAVYEEA